MPEDHKKSTKADAISKRLKSLGAVPAFFTQLERTERVGLADTLLKDAHALYRTASRSEEKKFRELWEHAAKLFHKTLSEAYSKEFERDYVLLKQGNPVGLENTVVFLEDDPWFFRSGYMKSELITFIKRLPLTPELAERLRNVVLAVIDKRDRTEFRAFCRLAKAVSNEEFIRRVEERLLSSDHGVRRRARWVLEAIKL